MLISIIHMLFDSCSDHFGTYKHGHCLKKFAKHVEYSEYELKCFFLVSVVIYRQVSEKTQESIIDPDIDAF